MTQEKNEVEIKAEDKNVKASKMQKGRKSIAYLQKLKDEGTLIVQMCPANTDQYFAMAAEMANCDVCRLTVPAENTPMSRANVGRLVV